MAGLNFRFAVMTEEEKFQMQDNAISNDIKEATHLRMKVFKR